ncbi:MAG: hypothetical protein PHO48_04790 [Candidatus Gracilibacteria bacterium]|nr:hypothetical protein [Candidatus Gracilibacteria bacterium]MDD5179546.1 hypothetical protein [Candidatus Gracilibacteria bacterium]
MPKPSHLKKAAIILVAALTLGAISLLVGSQTARYAHRRPPLIPLAAENQPTRPAEVFGRIKLVVGNQVTIAKLERQNKPMNDTDWEKRKKEWDTLTAEQKIAKFEERLNSFSGEDITITIPTGLKLYETQMPQQKDMNQDANENLKQIAKEKNLASNAGVEITLADLKPNSLVAVWLDGKVIEENIAEFLNLITTTASNPTNTTSTNAQQ